MRISDEKRREAAARLHKCGAELSIIGADCETGFHVIDKVIGCRDVDSWEGFLDRLADLIEPPEITEDTSDGYHTFGQLYYQRMVLFAVLVQEHKDCAWKTRNHEDGEPCFGGGWFLVTIDTPRGAYGYHFEEKYWRLFDCAELPKAKHWDGYTEYDVNRLFSLNGYEVSGDATD